MLTVEQIIGDLLMQHNCVVVPNFGGFVAKRVPAQVDTTKGVVIPPRKSVLFNRSLTTNDGLLIQTVSLNHQIQFDAAEITVQERVNGWNSALKSGDRVSIDRVGILYMDAENNINFEQDRTFNLLLESFGLGPVHFVPAQDIQAAASRVVIQQAIAEQNDEAPIIELAGVPVFEVKQEDSIPIQAATKKRISFGKVAMVACTLPILFYSFWIPMKTDVLESGVININDFNPFHHKAAGAYRPDGTTFQATTAPLQKQLEQLSGDVAVFSYEVDEDSYLPIKLKENVVVEAPSYPTTTPAPVANTTSASTQGYVIIGSYSTEANAQERITELKNLGIAASMLKMDGKIRLTTGQTSNYSKEAAALKAKGIDSWLLD